MISAMLKRFAVLALVALAACDQKDESAEDAAAALSALIPPLPPPLATPSPGPSTTALPPPSLSASTIRDASRDARVDASGACAGGDSGLPDCPLQAWMKKNMTPPILAKDWQGMADSLERAALLAPPDYAKSGYTNWVSICHDGANAARAAEYEAVKAACRGCHEQYKTKYRTEMRQRPLPP